MAGLFWWARPALLRLLASLMSTPGGRRLLLALALRKLQNQRLACARRCCRRA